ncbi:hypothetical protein B0T19DRAFT_486947 [Cercophora scortea]|uniref:Uncharacterized protein n=1 Tax=Cercophora scortea TaxID=314031 RepID=A0AAE0I889_9PEZI|nr:hypothetical protein B0T19DRAFT_486947 [Cercophora scortea]
MNHCPIDSKAGANDAKGWRKRARRARKLSLARKASTATTMAATHQPFQPPVSSMAAILLLATSWASAILLPASWFSASLPSASTIGPRSTVGHPSCAFAFATTTAGVTVVVMVEIEIEVTTKVRIEVRARILVMVVVAVVVLYRAKGRHKDASDVKKNQEEGGVSAIKMLAWEKNQDKKAA